MESPDLRHSRNSTPPPRDSHYSSPSTFKHIKPSLILPPSDNLVNTENESMQNYDRSPHTLLLNEEEPKEHYFLGRLNKINLSRGESQISNSITDAPIVHPSSTTALKNDSLSVSPLRRYDTSRGDRRKLRSISVSATKALLPLARDSVLRSAIQLDDSSLTNGEQSPIKNKNRNSMTSFSSVNTPKSASFLRRSSSKISPDNSVRKARKSVFGLRSTVTSTTLTFDAFVDQKKGIEVQDTSDYPSYKIDKRLIFLGKELEYPMFVIPYNSSIRRLWNIFIIVLILYKAAWYPISVTYLFNEAVSTAILVLEIVSIFIFLFDILINMRTTYTNENNEEIIDTNMLKKEYFKSRLFIIDVITVVPVSEILLLCMSGHEHKYAYYALFKLIGLLRLAKINNYSQRITMRGIVKVVRVFGIFFLLTHYLTCIWYAVIRLEDNTDASPAEIWFPPTMRSVVESSEDLYNFYNDEMSVGRKYAFTVISVFMLMLGGDLLPITPIEIVFAIIIGLTGAVFLAYIFGFVTLLVGQMNAQNNFYKDKLEQLTKKLEINRVPANLRLKVMEYFYYSWRKHRVLQKTNDFSELSLPLQRDLAFFQYQETIMKVPLFLELEPIEILSIIQKLKTSVYMPGDKIIREGERGAEMFFIQEGKVEIVIKKPIVQPDGQTIIKFEKIYLEKGSYFGEIALIANSKRTTDVNAYEFCILDTFSKTDYNNLKIEFPDIGPRLKGGLKHYKNNHSGKLINILSKLDPFEGFSTDELKVIVAKYMEEVFLDPDRLILKPKDTTNSMYVVLMGKVNCYANTQETKDYLKQLKSSKTSSQAAAARVGAQHETDEENDDLECLDDNILNMEKDQLSIDDQKKSLDLLQSINFGEYFGNLDFEENDTRCREYYVTDSGCQVGIINQALLGKMEEDDLELYEKLRNNIVKQSLTKVMSPIKEDANESVGLFKARSEEASGRMRSNSILSKRMKRQSTQKDPVEGEIKVKNDDIEIMKDKINGLEAKLEHFMGMISEIYLKGETKKKENLLSLDITPIAFKQMDTLSPKRSIFSGKPSVIFTSARDDKDDLNVEDLSGKKSIFEKALEGQTAQLGSGIGEPADINMKTL